PVLRLFRSRLPTPKAGLPAFGPSRTPACLRARRRERLWFTESEGCFMGRNGGWDLYFEPRTFSSTRFDMFSCLPASRPSWLPACLSRPSFSGSLLVSDGIPIAWPQERRHSGLPGGRNTRTPVGSKWASLKDRPKRHAHPAAQTAAIVGPGSGSRECR